MAKKLAQRGTLKELLDYAVKGMAGAKKVCPKAAAKYADAANAIAQKQTSGEIVNSYTITQLRNRITAADKFCSANRKAGTPATPPALDPKIPTLPVPASGPLAFMDKLPGPKWAYFVGVGLITTILVFPKQMKSLLKL